MDRLVVALALVVALGACKEDDGDGGGGECTPVAACGGDIEGTWNVQDICVDNAAQLAGMAVTNPECRNLFVSAETSASGTMSFMAGTSQSNAILMLDLRAVWTLPCLRAVAGVQNIDLAGTCANLDMEYGTNPQFTGGSCMVMGETCDCIVSAEQPLVFGNTYTIQGNQIAFPGEGTTNYCVEGSTLRMGAMNGSMTGTVTLTK